MTSASASFDPWPLLRKHSSSDQRRALRLVVHGRSGGVIPGCLCTLEEQLKLIRRAPVQLEVLTAEKDLKDLNSPTWLFPLLLWPGSHVCSDVPAIRAQLRGRGVNVTMLPFLGALPQWWIAVMTALAPELSAQSVLIHHPLRPGVADRFLAMLASRLALPLVPFDAWPEFQQRHPKARPLPLTLAPNRMTDALSEAGGLPPLLEHPPTRQALIDLLVSLP